MKTEKEFLLSVIDSEKFKNMNTETRVLYFYLFIHADENGIVYSEPIFRKTCFDINNIKTLVDNNLIKNVNMDFSGYVVSIVGWDEIKFEEI